MSSINVREGRGVINVIRLDECGVPLAGDAEGLIVTSSISEFGFEDTIEDGDSVTERNFGGRKCYTDVGADEISNVAINLTTCGILPALDSILIASATKSDGGVVKGFGRMDLGGTVAQSGNVAIEVLMQLDTDACDGGGAAPIAGWLFPLVKNWRPAQATTLNGTDLVKPAYSAKGFKNANLFDSPVEPLDKWILDDKYIPPTSSSSTDGEWYSFYIFDAVDVDMPTEAEVAAFDNDPTTLVASTT